MYPPRGLHSHFAVISVRGIADANASSRLLTGELSGGVSDVEAILEFALRLYRAAREAPADGFQDVVLAALADQKRFSEHDHRVLRLLMPHLSEARTLNRSLGFNRASVLLEGTSLAERLTRRELEVAQLFGAGRTYKQIAQRCGLSPTTVRNRLQRAYRKLSVNSKLELAQLIHDSAKSG